jgi:hypothetical protein
MFLSSFVAYDLCLECAIRVCGMTLRMPPGHQAWGIHSGLLIHARRVCPPYAPPHLSLSAAILAWRLGDERRKGKPKGERQPARHGGGRTARGV